jgi:hypothetical protein
MFAMRTLPPPAVSCHGRVANELFYLALGTFVQPGGSTYQHPAADPARGEFVIQEAASPDLSGGSPNNNSMSSVIVTDQHGNVLRRPEQFNFFNTFLPDMGDYMQLNPPISMAFTLGPGGRQLYTFNHETRSK